MHFRVVFAEELFKMLHGFTIYSLYSQYLFTLYLLYIYNIVYLIIIVAYSSDCKINIKTNCN